MASAKNRRKKYTSKGIVGGASPGIKAAVKAARVIFEKELNQIKAWKKGQNPWITVPSSSNMEKNNKPWTKVRANDLWGRYGR